MSTFQIQAGDFKEYPPEARRTATGHIRLLRELPIAFRQLLLQQIQEYDWRFPAERREIVQQLVFLESLSDIQRRQLLTGFEQLTLPSRLTSINWTSSPGEFSEQLSAYLWASHQIDAFREASSSYLAKFGTTVSHPKLAAPRLGIAVIGKGVKHNSYPLFRKFRPHGTYFTRVDPTAGLQILLDKAAARAASYPAPFDHWYVDGGIGELLSSSFLISLSYGGLAPIRKALIGKIDKAIKNGTPGPEALVSLLHRLQPEEIGLAAGDHNAVISHFEASLLTAGSGTQIFSTTFVQFAVRELWRRAQPLTVLARFAPRQRERPMNELLSSDKQTPELDPNGSLVDADMGAFYMWLDQQRLPGGKEASFLVWFENHNEAFLISPSLPRNTESNSPVNMHWLLAQVA